MASELKVDTISEKTSGNGVTIDGALIKDSKLASTAGGGLVLLQTGTASNSSELLFDDFVDLSTYPSYFIVFSRIYSQNDNVEFQVNFRTGGSSGADLTGTYYQGGVYYEADTTGGTIFENNSRTDNQVIDNNLGNGTAEAIVGSAYFYPATGTASTSNVNVIEHKTMHQRATDFMRFIHRATFHESVDATTGLKFTMSSGNISSGTIRIYGVKS